MIKVAKKIDYDVITTEVLFENGFVILVVENIVNKKKLHFYSHLSCSYISNKLEAEVCVITN